MDTGTPALRSRKKNLTSIPAMQEQQLLEQVHILLVLEQRAVQRRNQLLGVVAAQRVGRYVFRHQELDPIEKLRGGGLFLQTGGFADLEECGERLAQQLALQIGIVHIDDLRHRRFVRKADVVEKAAPQKGVRQLLLIVAGDDDDRPVFGVHRLARFVDVELHAVQFAQEVVGELDVRLVDLVDQQHRLHLAVEGLPQIALDDVVADVLDPGIPELRIAQARYGVVLVQALLRLGGGLDVPFEQRLAERAGDLRREQRLAGAGFALDQERPRQHHRGVHRGHQFRGGYVAFGAAEFRFHDERPELLADGLQDLHRIGAAGDSAEFALGENDQISLLDQIEIEQQAEYREIECFAVFVGDGVSHRIDAAVERRPAP